MRSSPTSSGLPQTPSFSDSMSSLDSSVTALAARPTSRWRTADNKRLSLRNLLLGVHTSSWTSQPAAHLADPAYTQRSPSTSTPLCSTPSAAGTAAVDAADDAANNLVLSVPPVIVVATNTVPVPLTTDSAEVGGGKTIDYVGSVALLINNVTGGGMVLFAQMYQQAGWLLPTLTLLLLMIICGLGGLMLVECMAMMPHNGRFRRRIEYTSVMRHYCTHRVYAVISVFYHLSLFVTNLSLIVQSCQVMDFAIVAIAHRTCALPQFYPSFGFGCPLPPEKISISPFESGVYCIPLGLYFTALFVIPLGLVNLDDNIKVQKGAFYSLIIIVLIWVGLLAAQNPTSNAVRAVGANFNTVLGTSLFNFAFVSSVPSWVNEKAEGVSIVRTLCTVLPLAVVIFVLMGWLGGAAFPVWPDSSDTLLDLLRGTTTVGEVTFYAFPIVVNLTSIPVLSIFQRYNLLKERVCGKRMANFLAVVLPWLVAIPLYNGDGYQQLANWGGVLVTSVVNFIVPVVVYIIAVRRRNRELADVHQTATAAEPEVTGEQDETANGSDDREDLQVQVQVTAGGQLSAAAKATTERKAQRLSLSAAVQRLRRHGSGSKTRGDEDADAPNGLRPSPLPHFGLNTSLSPSSFSIASTDGSDSGGDQPVQTGTPPAFSPLRRTPLQLNAQATRWAAEMDRAEARLSTAQATPLSASYVRDSTQPSAGSFRLAPPSNSASRSISPLTSAASSSHNLLAGLASSSFTAPLSYRPGDDNESSMEMTHMSSALRSGKAKGATAAANVADFTDDFFADIGATAVEDEQPRWDEPEDEKVAVSGTAALSTSSRHLTLSAIDEAKHEQSTSLTTGVWTQDVEVKVRHLEEKHTPLADEQMAEIAQEDERGEVWHVVDKRWEQYRVGIAVIVLAVMVALCSLALGLQIHASLP